MTALAEALLAAQRQMIDALKKAYLADAVGIEEVLYRLKDAGCTDVVEQQQLIHTLNTLKDFGAQATNGAKPDPAQEPASQKQLDYIASLAKERNVMPPDWTLTKERASEAITELRAGTYDEAKWTAPF